MNNDPTNWNISTRPGLELFHKFIGKGKQILNIAVVNEKLFVQLERGLYYFPSLNSKPRKVA